MPTPCCISCVGGPSVPGWTQRASPPISSLKPRWSITCATSLMSSPNRRRRPSTTALRCYGVCYRLQRAWFRRSALVYGRSRLTVAADLKVKVPQRVMVPLQTEQVQRFWRSFRTARDLAIVALMLLNGLRSREVLALQLEDLLFSEAQIR